MPFTPEEFREVFRLYNEAVWPMQWVLVIAAIAAVVLARARSERAHRVAAALLAGLWVWVGVAYHAAFFLRVTPAAALFGAMSVLQGVLLAAYGVVGDRLRFDARPERAAVRAGGLMILFALLFYPAFGIALGHRYPAAPTFGLSCPLTIFTLGMLLLGRPPVSAALLAVPVAWAAVGTSAAVQLGMWEDLSLPVAAIATLALSIRRRVPRPA